MADYPYDEEQQRDPLLIQQRPRPSGDLVEQNHLQQAPDEAPTPTVQVDAFARGAPPADQQEADATAATAPVYANPVADEAPNADAYSPATVPVPKVYHQVLSDPTAEQHLKQTEQERATKLQSDQQKQENTRVKQLTKGLKDQGIEMITDLDGTVHPKVDDQGRTIFKPAVLSPFEDRGEEAGSNRYVSVHRDRFGNEQDVPLKSKIDPKTGEKYVTAADGVSRFSLGVDEDYVLRRDVTNLGKVASEARAEVAAIGSQRKELKEQIAEYGNRAAVIASKKTLTDDDRAEVKRLQTARQSSVSQLDQLDEAHDEKSKEAQAATGQWLEKRKLITDKIKQQMGVPGTPAGATAGAPAAQQPNSSTSPEATPAVSPSLPPALPSPTPFSPETPHSPIANPTATAAAPAAQSLPPQQKQAIGGFVAKAMGIGASAWARWDNAWSQLIGSGASTLGKGLEGFAQLSESISHGLFGGDDKATATRAVANALMKVPGVLTAPDADKKYPESSAIRMVGDYGTLIGEGVLDPAIPVAHMFGLGYEGQHDAAKQYFDKQAAANPGAPRDLAHESAVADAAGIKGAAINTVLAFLPIGKAAKSIQEVFGKGSADAISRVMNEAYEKGGAAGVANELNALRDAMTRVTGAGEEAFQATASKAIEGVISEITQSPVKRLAAVGARSAADAAAFGGAQVAQNLVTKSYNSDTGLFENVPSSLATGAVMGAVFGGLEQVHRASTAAKAREDIASGMAKPARGRDVPPEAPAGPKPDPAALADIRDAMAAHAEDLRRERDILQGEVSDTAQPVEGKGDKIARIEELNQQIEQIAPAVTTTPSNETTIPPSALSPDQAPATAPGPSGTTDDRPVPNQPEAGSEVQQPPQEVAEPVVRDGQAPATGEQPSGEPGADAGLNVLPPEGGQLHPAQMAGAHVVSTAVQHPAAGPGGPILVGSKWNEPHEGIGARHGLDTVPEGNRGFIVQNSKGEQMFVDRQTAVPFAAAGRQLKSEPGLSLKSEHLQAATVDAAAHEAATSPLNDKPTPSMAQHEADNAELGHDSIAGMPVSFENPVGSIRTNLDMGAVNKHESKGNDFIDGLVSNIKAAHAAGDENAVRHFGQLLSNADRDFSPKSAQVWANKMVAHYGRFKGITGADGDDLLDVFVKEGTPRDYNGLVFVVNQYKSNGDFDEHKVVVGAENAAEALALYKAHYPKDWKMGRNIVRMTMPQFKAWAKDSRGAFDKSKPVNQGNFRDGSNEQKTATVPVQEEAETSGGESEVGQSVSKPAGEQGGRLRDEEAPVARSRRLVSASLLKSTGGLPPPKATLDAMGAVVKDASEDPSSHRGKYSLRAGFVEDAKGNPQFIVFVDHARLGEKIDHMADWHAAEMIDKALEEEVTHVAQMEAVRREWVKTKDATGWDYLTALEAEYQQVEEAMDDTERAAVREAYGEHGAQGELSGSTLGAEFVRQLLQQKRTGKVTEATMRATSLIERLLAVLKSAWENIKARSEVLRRAIEHTEAVLDEISPRAKSETQLSERDRATLRNALEKAIKDGRGINAENAEEVGLTLPEGWKEELHHSVGEPIRVWNPPAAATPAEVSAGPVAKKGTAQWEPELQAAFKKFKTRLTRAQNAKDWQAVAKVAKDFNDYYEAAGTFPDDWSRFARAGEDAERQLRLNPPLVEPVTKPIRGPGGATTLWQTLRDRVLAARTVQDALKNTPQSARAEIGAVLQAEIGKIAPEVIKNPDWRSQFNELNDKAQMARLGDMILASATKKPATPQVPALPGMTPLGGKPDATGTTTPAAPASDKPLDSGASADLKAQAKKAFEGLFAPEAQFSGKEIAVAMRVQRGESPEAVALAYAMPVERVEQVYDRVIGAAPLNQEHGINMGAPEPVQQIKIPKERRQAFMDLADKMEEEGITTPEKVAAFINEISDGRALQYTKAFWKIMESTGAVDEADAPANWDPVISLATTGGGPNVESHEPAVGSSGSDSGEPNAAEDHHAGEVEANGAVSGEGVPAEAGRPGAGHAAGGGRGKPASPGVGPGGESVATSDAGDSERIDSPVAGAGPRPGGDTSLTRPTGRPDGGAERSPAERNFRIGPGDIAPRGTVAKLKANLSAVRLLKQIEKAKRPATDEERAKLVQYTGWGQFKGAFDEIRAGRRGSYQEDRSWNEKWGKTYDQLKALLTPEEWRTAAESTLNAHYTARGAIEAQWNIIRRLGFNGGRVLENALGIGHYYGLMPQDLMDQSKLFGLDMDTISASIAKLLYPEADIKNQRFEKAKFPNNYFDLITSNFPFHEVGPVDSRYPQLNLHNYFFARSFDLAKPGGLVVAITSNSTLDNNPDQRAYLASKADLVAAIRLPNTAFQENAGTEVTTDILIFRKPDGTPFKGEPFLNTVQVGEDKGQPIVANEYFARHPEMAIGKHSLQGTMYRKDSYALTPDKYRPLAESLQEAIKNVPADVFSHSRDFYEQQQQDFGVVREGEKEGSISFRDGSPLQVVDSEYKQPAWAQAGFKSRMRDPQKRIEIAKSFVALRDQMKELLAEELNPAATDAGLDATRSKLRDLYDQHVKKFDQLEKGNMKFLQDDPEYYLVMGLEVTSRERKGETFEKVIRPADILNQRTLFPVTPPSHTPEVKDAVMVSMQYRGKIDIPYVSELTGLSAEDAESTIIDSGAAFKNPVTGLLETRDAYLSSNVRQKLAQAEAALQDDARYQKNVDELKAIQPERVGFENIRARAGSSWIPEPVYTSFLKKVLGPSAKAVYNKTLDQWSVSLDRGDANNAENKSIYGTERASGSDIFTNVLNLRSPKIYDYVEELNDAGKVVKKQVLNKTATDQAQAKALRFKQEFDTFMREDPDANKSIEDTYNDKFNSYVVPLFDGTHMVFPGMASVYRGKPLKLRSNQKDGIFRVTQTGGALLAHGVGAGKTITQIAAAMEMRRLGLARKPLIVVDKPTIGQFAQTFRQVYPNANVLVATEDSFTAPNRKRFMSRIATGNWDAIVMSNSQFDLMPNDPAVIQQYVQTAIDQLKEVAAEVEQEEGKGTPKVRQIQTQIKRLENKLGKLLEKLGKRQDNTIYFEQSGVDALFVDEVHNYKKVPFVTKMDPVKGIDQSPSQKAITLHAKVRFIHENNRNRNVITATGTPVTNTLAEAWNMTRLVAPQLLEEWGVDTFDRFVSTFAEVVNSTEINAANQWVSVERLSRFTNGPELVKLIRTAWDVKMGEDLKDLKLPAIKGGKPELVSLDVTPEQLRITEFLQSAYRQFQGMTPKQRRQNSWVPIVTMGTGMAAAVDPRLVNPNLPDNPNSVLNEAVRNIVAIHKETAKNRSTQIVFLDRYRPMNTEKLRAFASGSDVHIGEGDDEAALKSQANRETMGGDGAFLSTGLNLYNDMRDKLVAAGIPRDEIAIAHEHDAEGPRLRMQEDMQTGRIRVLIGSTAKIGQGINVSDKLYAAHHLDPPLQMTPAQYIQRNGRILRDPNENAEIRLLTYGMKRTLAAGIWDRINTKAKFIIQILMGKGIGRDFEDPADEVTMSIAEQVAELTGDRRVLRKVELESEVRGLQAAREAHYNNVGAARRKIRETQEQLDKFDKDLIPAAEADKTFLENAFGPEGGNFSARIGEKTFTDIKDYEATIKDIVETGEKKAEDYFSSEEGKKHYSVSYDIHQTINGMAADAKLRVVSPERGRIGGEEAELQTVFSTPNTRAIGHTSARVGKYIFFAAKKLWTERDERIEQLKAASQKTREQLPKLEAEAGKVFVQEKELNEKSAELDTLTRQLLGTDTPTEAQGGSLTDEAAPPDTTEPPALSSPEPLETRLPDSLLADGGATRNIIRWLHNAFGVDVHLDMPGEGFTMTDRNGEQIDEINDLPEGANHLARALEAMEALDGQEQREALDDALKGLAKLMGPKKAQMMIGSPGPTGKMTPGMKALFDQLTDEWKPASELKGTAINEAAFRLKRRGFPVETRLAELEGGNRLEYRRTPQPNLGAPEPAPAPDPTQGVLKSAFAELPEKERRVLSMRLANKSDAEIGQATGLPPVGIETAYQIALRKMERARQAAADVRGTMRRVVAEKPGQRTLGRPGLANPAAGDLSRKLVDTVDEIRKQSGVPGKRKDKDVIAAARTRLQKNYAGERANLVEKATRGIQLDDEETVMAKKIVAREALKAVRGGNDDALLEGAKLIDAYRMTGSVQARAFRQRFDNYLSPEERASEYLAESLLTPDQGRRDRLSRLAEQVTDLEEQLEEAKQQGASVKVIEDLNDERTKKLAEREAIILNWTKKINAIKKKLAKMGIDLDTMTEDEITSVLKDRNKANKAVRAVAAAKADNWDALYEYWINGLLSAPTTVSVKMLSDVAHATLDFGPQRWIEAAVNMVVPGDKSQNAQFGELPYVYKAIFPALGKAFTNFLKSWQTESPAFEGEFTNSEFHRMPAIEGVKGQIARIPTRTIMAADDAASSALATMQVQAEAYRIATAEGKTGDALAKRMIELTEINSGDPSDAWVAARSHSAYLRFQAELGPMGKWLQRGKKNVPIIRYIIPFVKTMSNIFKIGLRKSPLGSARLLYKMGREGAAKAGMDSSDYEYDRKNFVRDASEQILAWALVFGLLGLTRKKDEDDGLPMMTGTVPYTPSSRGERDLAMRTAPPTSIRIGGKWYNYSRIEPWGVQLATTVDLINQAREVQASGDVTAAMGKLLNHTLTQVKDKTFARGISDILNAIQDGEHAVEWIGNFTTSWEPFTSFTKAAARNSDDSIRETRVWGRDEWGENMLAALKYKAFPAANDVIQPKIDLWGNELKRDSGMSPQTDWLYRMTVPVQTQKAGDVHPLDRMLLNWNNAHPSEPFAPVPPPPMWEKKVDGKNQTIYMSRDEYRRFMEVSGKAAVGRLEIQGLNYNEPTREDIEAVKKAIEKARKDTRETLWQEHLGSLAR